MLRGGALPYDDGYTDWAGGAGGAASIGGGGMYSGGTESATVYGGGGGYSYSGPSYSVQTPSFSPSYYSPSFTFNNYTPGYTSNYFQNTYDNQNQATESATVSAQPDPQQVQPPDIPDHTPQWYFDQIAIFEQQQAEYWQNFFNQGMQNQTESATVSFQPPDPQQAQAPAYLDNPYGGPVQTDYLLPDFGSMLGPDKKAPAGGGGGGAKAPAGGGSGSGGGQAKPEQQKPVVQNFNFPKTGNSILPFLNQGQVTPQQQAALSALTAAQLAALLKNPNLTPQQKAAVQQALANKLAAPLSAGGAGMSPAAAAKAAAAAASPFQAKAAVLPAILIGGVLAAYAVTHKKDIAVTYASARRRVRKVFA